MALVERQGASGDGVVSVAPLAAWIDDLAAFFGHPEDEVAIGRVLRSASTGRPAGAADWIAELERTTAQRLAEGITVTLYKTTIRAGLGLDPEPILAVEGTAPVQRIPPNPLTPANAGAQIIERG